MDSPISPDQIKTTVMQLPDLAAWPHMANLFAEKADPIRMDWKMPVYACLASGGEAAAALPAAAAMACLQISIILADDILDQDPRGEYRRLGEGRTANLALGFQAAAIALIEQARIDAEHRNAAMAALARAALRTALGQDLDIQNLRGEENYWRVVKTKSTPFYGCAFEVGALLGGANRETASALYQVGAMLGEIIQIFDDLMDAFESPANPDWLEGRNNLTLLYASNADHPERQRFLELLPCTDDPLILEQAQQTLISSGAVSYCVYLLAQRYAACRQLLAQLKLANPDPLVQVLRLQMVPLEEWLRDRGLAVPFDLGAGEDGR